MIGLLIFWLDGILRHDDWLKASLAMLVWFSLLFLLFVLTGFEVAYTDLRDKDAEQVKQELRELLIDMQSKEECLYQAKEWATLFVTVCLALLTEWHIDEH
jgi:ammonia channel protein AmtB